MKYIGFAATAAILLSRVSNALTNGFETVGTPEGDACTGACKVFWKDSKGCEGDAEAVGACSLAFDEKDNTDDTGVDVCDGGGMFLCETANGYAIFVINTADEVSAAYVPQPKSCTLVGQCAPCDAQDFCGPPQYIGNIGGDGHNCKALNKKLMSASPKPKGCS